MAQLKSTYTGPRWKKAGDAIKQTAFLLDLKLELEIDKGFITESGRFKVTGSDESVQRFAEWWTSIG